MSITCNSIIKSTKLRHKLKASHSNRLPQSVVLSYVPFESPVLPWPQSVGRWRSVYISGPRSETGTHQNVPHLCKEARYLSLSYPLYSGQKGTIIKNNIQGRNRICSIIKNIGKSTQTSQNYFLMFWKLHFHIKVYILITLLRSKGNVFLICAEGNFWCNISYSFLDNIYLEMFRKSFITEIVLLLT